MSLVGQLMELGRRMGGSKGAFEYMPELHSKSQVKLGVKQVLVAQALEGLVVSSQALQDVETLMEGGWEELVLVLLSLARPPSPPQPQQPSSTAELEYWKGHAFRMILPETSKPISIPPPAPSIVSLPCPTCSQTDHYPIQAMITRLDKCLSRVRSMAFPTRLQHSTQRKMEQFALELRVQVTQWWDEKSGGRISLERFARTVNLEISALIAVVELCLASPTFVSLVNELGKVQPWSRPLAKFSLPLVELATEAVEYDVVHRYFTTLDDFVLDLPQRLGGPEAAERCGKCKVLRLKYALPCSAAQSIATICDEYELGATELCMRQLIQVDIPSVRSALLFNTSAVGLVRDIQLVLERVSQPRKRFQLACYERFHFYHAIEVHLLNLLAWEFLPSLEAKAAAQSVWELEQLISRECAQFLLEPITSPLFEQVCRPGVYLDLDQFREARNSFVRFLVGIQSARWISALDCNGFHLAQAI
ncbi:hypothetical protein BASA81_006720 [Batrachochytrium salamandrivorans]|nr:hypothetical protein BASA81_006720 [Batrachochytrium salamandrivorans]